MSTLSGKSGRKLGKLLHKSDAHNQTKFKVYICACVCVCVCVEEERRERGRDVVGKVERNGFERRKIITLRKERKE